MPKPHKEVFFITQSGEKSFFNRCGVAFENKDGSLNVILNAFPTDGKLHIRDPKEREQGEEG
jgi:hypothetical protein